VVRVPVPAMMTGGGVIVNGNLMVVVCLVVVKVTVVVERQACKDFVTVDVRVVVPGISREEQALEMLAGRHVDI
jgi:hypothetical protein